ncbi:hypothetical protein IWX49DRAFT_369692 [Phyllosticta citricarpa]
MTAIKRSGGCSGPFPRASGPRQPPGVLPTTLDFHHFRTMTGGFPMSTVAIEGSSRLIPLSKGRKFYHHLGGFFFFFFFFSPARLDPRPMPRLLPTSLKSSSHQPQPLCVDVAISRNGLMIITVISSKLVLLNLSSIESTIRAYSDHSVGAGILRYLVSSTHTA